VHDVFFFVKIPMYAGLRWEPVSLDSLQKTYKPPAQPTKNLIM
jgi:hypothetical protein